MRHNSSETRMTFRSKFSMEEVTTARTSWRSKTERAGREASEASPTPAPAIIASNWVVGGVWFPAGPHLRFYSPACQERELAAAVITTIRRQSLSAARSESSTLTRFFQDDATLAPRDVTEGTNVATETKHTRPRVLWEPWKMVYWRVTVTVRHTVRQGEGDDAQRSAEG